MRSADDRMPGMISGIMTSLNVWNLVAPRSIAASVRLLSSCLILGLMDKIAKGTHSAMCDMINVNSLFCTPRNENRSMNEIPVTRSGITFGTYVIVIAKP